MYVFVDGATWSELVVCVSAENPITREQTSEHLKPAAKVDRNAIQDRVCWNGQDPSPHSQALQGQSATLLASKLYRFVAV